TVLGGEELQAQVLVNADKLRVKQISVLEMKERLSKISEASSGGFIVDGGREWLVRNFGRILSHDEIAETAIGLHFGRPVVLSDVAEVKFAAAPKRGEAAIAGRPGVILMVQKQPQADTLKLTRAIDRMLESLKAAAPEGVSVRGDLFKQANFINAAIGNVFEALRDGSIMVAIVLLLFLLNARTTLITLTAIPISLLITAIVFQAFGIGVNTMTLGGLAIAIGELVDDAIVDVENVFRRLRENRLRPAPRAALRVVFEASSEIRNSIVFATVIVVLVFIPLFALPGFEGRLFIPIGVAYVVSLLASLLVSLTITPVLCSYLLTKGGKDQEHDGALVRWLKGWDRRLLMRTLDRPGTVIAGSAFLVALAVSLIPLMGRNFLPPFNEGSAMMEVLIKPGVSLEASSAVAGQIEAALMTVPEVKSIGRRTGRAEQDDHSAGVHQSEFEIALKESARSRAQVFADLREKARARLPEGGFISLSQPISHRLDHVLSGVKSQVAIKLYGPELRVLRQGAAEIRNAIQGTPGVVDLRMEGQTLFPQYKIYGMRPDLKKYGILPGDLMESLEAMLQGV
ncbi:MAG TPA: efflux RND transporter permease subunit, partial [Bdellovibrionales bacterium]|nr:efflux RND transporter permease subunit [Bdellovibrionales bacterium]